MGAHGGGMRGENRGGDAGARQEEGLGLEERGQSWLGGYLGHQGLPIPQPPHRGPGLARGHAAPAQVGADVGLGVRDHVQPVGLGCGGQEREGRAKELS